MFRKVLVANRAEIAVRVLRTCRELGITGVAVYSTPDADALHVRVADEAVHLPGTTARETYLDIDAVVAAARRTGADAVHPGYGFLAENASFAQAVQDAGLVFIGPPSDAIAVMGEKVAARQVASRAQVPQVPGTSVIATPQEIVEFGDVHGYPVAVKASYGGGGRGMRTVASAAEAEEAWESARREAKAAFGRDEVYLERYLDNARHVEVQIFADSYGNVVWLGDRDCSVQRRHQKLVEEAPAPGLSDQLRTEMGEASVRLARAVGYVGAGTVEYLVETDPERFFFLEMNTRIQVEHPVTELTLGVDLVAEQLRVATGEPLSFAMSGPQPRGHAIEIRVNAEDVTGGSFRPSPGPVTELEIPTRAGVRFDGGYVAGDEVQPFYDSLIGKLVVWAPTRGHAISRVLETIRNTTITGVPSTLPVAEVILRHPDFRNMSISTRWLEQSVDLSAQAQGDPDAASKDAAAGVDVATDHGTSSGGEWDRDELYVAGRRYAILRSVPMRATAIDPALASASRSFSGVGNGRPTSRSGRPPRDNGPRQASGTVASPMQGTVVKIAVTEGQKVTKGEVVIVIEAMKMENPIRAAVSGTVASLMAKPGQVVAAGTALAEISPDIE